MKHGTLLLCAAALGLSGAAIFGQEPDPNFFGSWRSDIAKFKTTQNPPQTPKAQLVRIGPDGWIYSAINSNGNLEQLAVSRPVNGSCVVIAMPKGYSCEFKSLDPRRATFVMKFKDTVVQTFQTELLPDNKSFKQIVKFTPPGAAAYSVEMFWEKMAAAAKK